MKLAICGGPHTGKSALAEKLSELYSVPVVHTDDWIKDHSWSDVPDRVLEKLATLDGWIVEGTQAARVVRRMLNTPHPPSAAPLLDGVYWLEKTLSEVTEKHQSMAKGIATIFAGIRPVLAKASIPIFPGLPPSMFPPPPRRP